MRKLLEVLKVLLLLCCLAVTTRASATDVWVNPAPFPVGMDTWFGSVYNTSAQHDYRLRVGGWGDEYDTLLRFNLSGLPQVADHAYIYLYPIADDGTTTYIMWYLLSTQWHSGVVTWGTQPAGAFLGYTAPPTVGTWYAIDFTTQYNTWRSGNPSTANYGLKLRPYQTNNNFSSFYSSTQGGGYGPWLYVSYTPQSNDNILKLKWPLATSYANRVPTQPFGVDWAGGVYCNGLIEKHNGTDFQATAGTGIYAAEDGIVKQVLTPEQTGGWAYNIVLEHNYPQGGKYTTVYWHVIPTSDVISSNPDGFIPKGTQIATVADLTPYGHATHFHFGVRIGAYDASASGTGALPQTNCGGHPTFPAGFIDPNNTNNVLFQ